MGKKESSLERSRRWKCADLELSDPEEGDMCEECCDSVRSNQGVV